MGEKARLKSKRTESEEPEEDERQNGKAREHQLCPLSLLVFIFLLCG